MKLLLATTNQGKLRELEQLTAPLGFEIVSPRDVGAGDLEVVEDGATFEQNAIKKAREFSAKTGLPALADDSGLEVLALDGAPGVFSARYAGEPHDDAKNNAKLLAALAGVPTERRGARFRCVLALVRPGKTEPDAIVEGTCAGFILTDLRGENGFGYDPLFLVDGADRTLAELTDDEKNAVSHRGRALRAILPLLTRLEHA